MRPAELGVRVRHRRNVARQRHSLERVGLRPSFTPRDAGTYCFRADYGGDTSYATSSDASSAECFTVAEAASDTASHPSSGATTMAAGASDRAVVSGLADGPRPTGAVRFLACGPLASDSGCPAGSGSLIGSGPVALTSGSGETAIARSATFLPPRPGIWCLRAEYFGDGNYHASSDGGAGECVQVATPPPPSIDLLRPQDGHRYAFDATVDAHFSCHEGSGGPGITSCTGTVADGSAINTHRSGRHTFVVTATSGDGERTARAVHYTVAPDNRVETLRRPQRP